MGSLDQTNSASFHRISVSDVIRNDARGEIDLGRSIKELQVLVSVWQQSNMDILVDITDAQIRFSPADVRRFLEAVLETGIGRWNRVAMLYRPNRDFDPVRFFEFLCEREGIQIKVCESMDEAMNWLHIRQKKAG